MLRLTYNFETWRLTPASSATVTICIITTPARRNVWRASNAMFRNHMSDVTFRNHASGTRFQNHASGVILCHHDMYVRQGPSVNNNDHQE